MNALQLLHRAHASFSGTETPGVVQQLKRGTNSAISACTKGSHWPLGVQLLCMVKKDGIQSTAHDILCYNSLLLQMTGAHWKTAACLLRDMCSLGQSMDLATLRGCTAVFEAGACHSRFVAHVAETAPELLTGLRCFQVYRHEEHAIEAALGTSRLRALDCMPPVADRMMQQMIEAPALSSLQSLSQPSGASWRGCLFGFPLILALPWHFRSSQHHKEVLASTRSAQHRIHDQALGVCSSIGSAFVRCCFENRALVSMYGRCSTSSIL